LRPTIGWCGRDRTPSVPLGDKLKSMKPTSCATIAVALISALILIASPVCASWTLPIADGGDVDPSPPSVQGYLATVATNSITLKTDYKDKIPTKLATARLTPKTQFFSGYGGAYDADELRPGLYVWVWYITEDSRMAGTPPEAAVVMLWSKDPNDKPSSEVRGHFLKRK